MGDGLWVVGDEIVDVVPSVEIGLDAGEGENGLISAVCCNGGAGMVERLTSVLGVEARGDSAPLSILPQTASSQEPVLAPSFMEAAANPFNFAAALPDTRLWKSIVPPICGVDMPDGSAIADLSSLRCESRRYCPCSFSTRSPSALITLMNRAN